MKRWLVFDIKTGKTFGYIPASTPKEAEKILAKEKRCVLTKVVWQEKTIGFSDQWIVYEVGVKNNPMPNLQKIGVSKYIHWVWDKYTGAMAVSVKKDYTKQPVYDFSGKNKIGEIEHFSYLPTVTKPAFFTKKEDRHWYWTGWVYTNGSSEWLEVRNLITDRKGWVKKDGNLGLQKTLLESFFETTQNIITNIDNSFQKIVQGTKEFWSGSDGKGGFWGNFKNVLWGSVALGVIITINKIIKK